MLNAWSLPRRFETWTVALTLAALAGCATTQGGGSGGSGSNASPAGRPDLVTASDETDKQKRARIRLELAGEYFSQGKTATALDEVKLALVADPNLPQAFNLRGLIYASLGEHGLAEESFRRALALDARDADTLHNFGWYLCQRKRFPEAQSQFSRALEVPQYREQARTLLAQGVCQARAGELPPAEKTLLRAYEIDPGNPATAVNLADVLYRRGEYERARFYVKRVNAVPELSNAETLWLAARIENKLGNKAGSDDFGAQLKARFPQSRESSAFERRQFDE